MPSATAAKLQAATPALRPDVLRPREAFQDLIMTRKASISFHSFQMMRSVFISRRFFVSLRSNRIL